MYFPIGKISILLGMGLLWGRDAWAFSPTFCVAELRSNDRGSKINLRRGAGLEQPVIGTGDLVYLVSKLSPEPGQENFGIEYNYPGKRRVAMYGIASSTIKISSILLWSHSMMFT